MAPPHDDDLKQFHEALKQCQTLTPSLMTGDQAIERLKQINCHVYDALGRHASKGRP